MSWFFDLCKKNADKDRFKTQLFSFLDQVIMSKLSPLNINKFLPKVGLSALAAENAFVFAFQLKDDSNLVASWVQIHS